MLVKLQKNIEVKFEPYWMWQNNPLYKNKKLANGPYTIGSSGCAIASMLGLFNLYCNTRLTVGDFNKILLSHDGFVGSMCKWDILSELIRGVRFLWSIGYTNGPAELRYLRYPCIVRVDYDPSTKEEDAHYVLVLAKQDDDDLLISDPIDGKIRSFNSRFGFPTGGLERAIYQIIAYE